MGRRKPKHGKRKAKLSMRTAIDNAMLRGQLKREARERIEKQEQERKDANAS